MRAFFVALFLALPALVYAGSASSTTTKVTDTIDKILVVKSERTLHLMHRGAVIKSYRVSLGKKPGAKEYEGDQRTPEGLYWINGRKHSDNFNLAMHISYPNTTDLKRSEKTGLPPGNLIMLHGTPDDEEYPEWFFNTLDWTEGCIALTNSDMKEVWETVKDGTLIEIRP
ncbi:MAG TPA: L,D-transpeptidase family protein [Gammaproteobacteria bacterium]|nr:L,D-transpeptidase family protein [Gammaproteobacteria bacterium]